MTVTSGTSDIAIAVRVASVGTFLLFLSHEEKDEEIEKE
jgi:hypothetical protein